MRKLNKLVITEMYLREVLCTVCAVVKDQKVIELRLEPSGKKNILNNIYVGQVEKIATNIQAAFVRLNDSVNGYLPLNQCEHAIFADGHREGQSLRPGDQILVQINRDAMKGKLPALTANLNFSGKFLVLTTGNRKIGISNKLSKEESSKLSKWLDDERNIVRHLERVRDLWNAHIEVSNKEIVDIYTGNKLESTFDVDHFIPWSYVAHDEMWNLIPSNASVNRSKSNNLPEWNLYFNKMANMEYDLYKSVVEYDSIHKLFEKCYAKNLQSLWALEELYVKGNTEEVFKHKLETHLHPLYEAARMQGYREWKI